MICNHQSWVDIPALVQAFKRRTPDFKLFLKRQLTWVPLLGLAFWALDYPFMKRYAKAQLAKRPELRGDYRNDAAFRRQVQDWVSQLWRDKDVRIAEIRAAMAGETAA